jgi:hypothetical protein
MWPQGDFLTALKDAGVVDALVALLEHESPFCTAAAAGVLGWIGKTQEGGQAALAANGAVPALVRVIERQLPACALDGEMPIFSRSASRVSLSSCAGCPNVFTESVNVWMLGGLQFLCVGPLLCLSVTL